MHKRRCALLAAVVLSGFSGLSYAANVKDFYTSWQAVRQAAEAEDKPIYLHFTTTWCKWCRRIESETYPSKAGSKALEDFVAASLDCTDKNSPSGRENISLFKRLGGTGYPFLVMVTLDGVVLQTIDGYVPPAQFAATLNKAAELNREWTDFKKWRRKADRGSYEYHRRAMTVYGKLGRLSEAAQAARQLRKLDPDDKRGHAAEALLVQLRDSAARKPPDEQAERVEALAAEIRRRDPTNAKGVLQHVLVLQAIRQLEKVAATKDAKQRLELLDAVAEKVGELQRIGKLPEQVQILWAYIGQFNAAAGRKDVAVASLRKAYDAAPKSEIAPKIKQLIERLGDKR